MGHSTGSVSINRFRNTEGQTRNPLSYRVMLKGFCRTEPHAVRPAKMLFPSDCLFCVRLLLSIPEEQLTLNAGNSTHESSQESSNHLSRDSRTRRITPVDSNVLTRDAVHLVPVRGGRAETLTAPEAIAARSPHVVRTRSTAYAGCSAGDYGVGCFGDTAVT